MSRLTGVDVDKLNDAQKSIYDEIANGPRKGVRGPLAVWLHRPELARHAQSLGRYCRYDTSIEPRLSELVILIMGRYWLADYEWSAHKPFALEAGISIEVINDIRDNKQPRFKKEDEALVYAFMVQLLNNHRVDEIVYQAVSKALGETAIVDLVGIAGYYTLISMTIKVFEIPPANKGDAELPPASSPVDTGVTFPCPAYFPLGK